jgi:hypothetical protein
MDEIKSETARCCKICQKINEYRLKGCEKGLRVVSKIIIFKRLLELKKLKLLFFY